MASSHLSFDQLLNYVDDHGGADAETVELHIAGCDWCVNRIHRVRSAAALVDGYTPARARELERVAAAAGALMRLCEASSPWAERIHNWLRGLSFPGGWEQAPAHASRGVIRTRGGPPRGPTVVVLSPKKRQSVVKIREGGRLEVHLDGFHHSPVVVVADLTEQTDPKVAEATQHNHRYTTSFITPAGEFAVLCEPPRRNGSA